MTITKRRLTGAPTTPRRQRGPSPGSVEPFPTHLIRLAPQAVEEASAAHAEALARAAQLRAEQRAAAEALTVAEADDASNARAAVATDKPMQAASAPKAAAHAEQTRRAAEAGDELAAGTRRALIAALVENGDELRAAIAAEEAEVQQTAAEHAAACAAALDQLGELRALARELHPDVLSGSWAAFRPRRPRAATAAEVGKFAAEVLGD